MANSDQSVEAKFKVATDEATKSVNNLTKSLSKLKSEVLLQLDALGKLAKKLSKLTDASDKYTTSQRLLGTVLGDSTNKANKFIDSLSRMSGMSATDLTNTVAKFSQLGESFGMAQEQAEDFSESLTILSTKLSLLYGANPETMASNLRKALTGSKKGLQEMTGIVASETNMQAILYENGINREVKSLNEAEKAILQYAAISRMATNDTNVYTNAVNSLAWQKQMLKQQVLELSNAIGQVLTPAFTTIYTIMNAVLMVITDLIKALGKLFGISVKAREVTSGVSVGSGYSDLADNISKAEKAANKSLRSFDKLNNITTPSDSGASGGGGLSIDPRIGGLISQTSQDFLEISNRAREIADEILRWLGFTRDENNELQWSGELLGKNILEFIKKNWAWLIAVPVIVGLIWKWLKKIKGLGLNKALTKFASALNKLATGAAALMILGGIALVFKELGELFKAVGDSGLDLGSVLAILAASLLAVSAAVVIMVEAFKNMSWNAIAGATVILGGLSLVLYTLSELIKALGKSGLSLGEVLSMVAGLLVSILAFMAGMVVLAEVLVANPLALAGLVIVTAAIAAILITLAKTLPTILDALGKFIQKVAPVVIQLIRTIGDIINEIIYSLGDVLPPIIRSIGSVFNTVFNGISKIVRTVGDVIVDVLSGIKEIIGKIGDTVAQILNSVGDLLERVADIILNFINNLGPAIENSVNSIIRSVTNLVNFVISAIEYMINRSVDGINGIADVINQLPLINVKKKNYVSIPRFRGYAEGGFPKEGDFFYANEKGPELVGTMNNHPAVANNDQIVKGIQQGVFSGMMSALSHTDFGGNVVIEASGDTDGLLNFISFKQRQKERQFN